MSPESIPNNSEEKVESPPFFEDWMRVEYEQSYAHLRDRDSHLLGILKFYAALVCSIGTASVALLSVKDLDSKGLLIGGLFLATAFIGFLLLFWYSTMRRYFVLSARQLNAIRFHATKHLGFEFQKEILFQSIDSNKPLHWNWTSSHIIGIIAISILNSTLSGLGIFSILRGLSFQNNWIYLSSLFVLLTIGQILRVKKVLEKNDEKK